MFALLAWFEPIRVLRLGEESRHMQVDQVGLGLARCLESSALVSKVLPELAQCLEYSIAHVRVPHQRLCALQYT